MLIFSVDLDGREGRRRRSRGPQRGEYNCRPRTKSFTTSHKLTVEGLGPGHDPWGVPVEDSYPNTGDFSENCQNRRGVSRV